MRVVFVSCFLLLGDLLGGKDGHDVGQVDAGALDALGVLGQHDLDLHADRAGTEVAVAHGVVDEQLVGRTGLDHVAVTEGHGLRTLALDLAANGHLAALGARLHHEADDAVAGATDLQAAEQLEAQGLSLGHGRQATGVHALNEQGNLALLVLEALLDAGGQLADAAALLAQDFLRLRGADRDLRAARGHLVLDAGEAILSQLALQELVQLSVEHAVAHHLALQGELADHV
mmetsp:Transcript_27188/g.48821  ORF Transcript_27188/g.48821 Transcript_27188/m.48821 type:complete len:231 (-) Transcript_27188:20-712(-)